MSIIFSVLVGFFSLCDGYNIFEVRHLVHIDFAGSKRRYHPQWKSTRLLIYNLIMSPNSYRNRHERINPEHLVSVNFPKRKLQTVHVQRIFYLL